MQALADVAQLVERRLPKPTRAQSSKTNPDQYRQTNPAVCRTFTGRGAEAAGCAETWSSGRSRVVAGSRRAA